jgi:excinuclease ABC subunit A
MSKDDWVIDLGPEGGDKPVMSEVEGGGEIVAEAEHDGRSGGSFSARKHEQVAKEPRSYTGHYLAPLLKGQEAEVVETPKPKKARRTTAVREREAAK